MTGISYDWFGRPVEHYLNHTNCLGDGLLQIFVGLPLKNSPEISLLLISPRDRDARSKKISGGLGNIRFEIQEHFAAPGYNWVDPLSIADVLKASYIQTNDFTPNRIKFILGLLVLSQNFNYDLSEFYNKHKINGTSNFEFFARVLSFTTSEFVGEINFNDSEFSPEDIMNLFKTANSLKQLPEWEGNDILDNIIEELDAALIALLEKITNDEFNNKFYGVFESWAEEQQTSPTAEPNVSNGDFFMTRYHQKFLGIL